ncbi:amidohydrolase family protein [Lichenibacterium minor]|uniref:amidohydrolase family protein n=1 Tax=Lichenibacterium minor TaxID=2316528 RepID=UPI001A913141|nr:amidohydrolase family protein [Lichenibacterium minor]
MDGKIALEEHFSTEANNRHWNAKGEEDRNGKTYAQDVERRLLDPELCIAEMDRAGVQMSIMSLTSPGVQSVVDPTEATALARSTNDYAHSFVRKHPNRLSAFAAVALQDPEGAADEIERAVKELGLKGALINGYSNVGPGEAIQYLDEEPLEPFWERVAALGVPVYLHPREPLPSQMRSIEGYPELGGSAWAFFYETASHGARLTLSGLFDRHPNLQVILGHLGESLPFMLPRLQHRIDEQREGSEGQAPPESLLRQQLLHHHERALPYQAVSGGRRTDWGRPRVVLRRLPLRAVRHGWALVNPANPNSPLNINNPNNPASLNNPNNPSNINSPFSTDNPNNPYSGINTTNPYSSYNLLHPESPYSAANPSNPNNPNNAAKNRASDESFENPHFGLFYFSEGDTPTVYWKQNREDCTCKLNIDCPRFVYAYLNRPVPAQTPAEPMASADPASHLVRHHRRKRHHSHD